MSGDFHIFPRFLTIPASSPTLLVMPLSLVASQDRVPSRKTKSFTWVRVVVPRVMFYDWDTRLTCCTSVLFLITCKRNLLLVMSALITRHWRSGSVSANRPMSSANRRLLILCHDINAQNLTSIVATAMTTSNRMLKSRGERIQPCSTPTRVLWDTTY